MHDVNLRLLQTFACAAEEGSFRRVSEILKRSPSAISMQIRDLEEQLGIRLFVRTPKKVTLTAEGRMLFQKVKHSMEDIQGSLGELKDLAAKRRGRVSIGFARTLAASRMGQILMTYKRRFPESVVTIVEASTEAALDLLQNQEIEFYIGPELPNMREFDFEPLMQDRLFACVPPNLDDGADEMSLSALPHKPLVLLDRANASRRLLEALLEAEGLALTVNYEIQTAYTALSLADVGLGIAILPEIALDMGVPTGMRTVPIGHEGARRNVGIFTAKGYVRHGYAEQLLRLIRQDFATLDPLRHAAPAKA